INRGFVESLQGYHLTLLRLGNKGEPDLGPFQEVVSVQFDRSGALDVRPVLENEFALAYFPDVGLTAQSVLLANLRLAPVQIASMGHSVSSWGAEIDYWVSGAAVERPEDPGRNYSERLVLLPGSGAVHERPVYTPLGRRRSGPGFMV